MRRDTSTVRFWVGFLCAIGLLVTLPLTLTAYQQTMLVEVLIWGLLACSFNILCGYTGMLSFGQAMFFGVGGYAGALLMDRWGWSVLAAVPTGVLVAGTLAVATGLFVTRVRGHAFTLLTLIFSLALYYLALSQSWLTGGDDGYPIRIPDLRLGQARLRVADFWVSYMIVVGFFVVGFMAYRWFVRTSPWGIILKAIRENEPQAALLGYEIPWCKFLAWVVAGMLAGLAGALYATAFRYANVSWLHWTVSGDSVVWTLFGGKGVLLGPLVGTAALLGLKDALSTWNEHLYPLFVGVILIVLMLYAPDGLMGLVRRLIRALPEIWHRRTTWKRVPVQIAVQRPGVEAGYRHGGASPPCITSSERLRSPAPMEPVSISVDLPLLRIDGVVMRFGEVEALRGVTFELGCDCSENGRGAPERRPFLIGPNGSGKSVLFDIILGRQSPTAGRVWLRLPHGTELADITDLPPWKRAKLGIAAVTQRASVFPRLTVEENLRIAALSMKPPRIRFAPAGQLTTINQRVAVFLDLLGLTEVARRRAGELSHGLQRLLQLGTALITEPRLMLMDEPTSGLNVAIAERIPELLSRLRMERDGPPAAERVQFIVEHDLRWVGRHASRLLVLRDGALIAESGRDGRTVQGVLEEKAVQSAFLGRLE